MAPKAYCLNGKESGDTNGPRYRQRADGIRPPSGTRAAKGAAAPVDKSRVKLEVIEGAPWEATGQGPFHDVCNGVRASRLIRLS